MTTPPPSGPRVDPEVVELVLRLGHGLHRYGDPAYSLEERLLRVSRTLGVDGQYFSMPTALFASLGPAAEQRTFQIRIEPGAVELERLARLDEIAVAVGDGQMGAAAARREVDAVLSAPARYGALLNTVAFALTSGAAARFFGGGLREIALSAVIGLVTGLVAVAAGRWTSVARIFEPLAATLAAALATMAATWFAPVSSYTATLAGLIVLIPGFTVTVAMIELATRNLVSGTARLAGAAGTFLAMGFGVALGTRLIALAVGAPPAVTPVPLPPWTEVPALMLAPIGFTILLRARPADGPAIAVAGALAYGGARVGSMLLGPELGAFVGAVALGAASNAYARTLRRPQVVPLVPGMLLLVPGSIGFLSLSSLMGGDTMTGVEAAFRMTLVAVSLATGLLFANVLLPARRR